MMFRCQLLLLASVAGCGSFGLEHGKDSGGDEADEGLVQLLVLEPDSASLSGGHEITVRGEGFEGDVRFAFGNADVDVTVIDDETLVVLTPEVRAAAVVDVEVESDLGSARLVRGFRFVDDGGGTGGSGSGGSGSGGSGSGGSGSGGSGGGTGVTIGVQMDYLAVPCMDCFGVTSQVFVEAIAMLHGETAGSWRSGLPASGTCTTSSSDTPPVSSTYDAGTSVTIQTGGAAYALTRTSLDGLTAYVSQGMGQADYVRSASWDLVVGDASPWGAFSVSGALQTTSGFTDIQPLAVFEEDPLYAFTAVDTSALQFTWAPSAVSELVVVDIQVFDALTGSPYPNGNIVCAGPDSGALLVPSTYFGAFYQGDLAAIHVYRWDTSIATHPVDGTTVEGMTRFGAIGTATLY